MKLGRGVFIATYVIWFGLFVTFLVLYLVQGTDTSNRTAVNQEWGAPEHPSSTLALEGKYFSPPPHLDRLIEQARQNFTLSRLPYYHDGPTKYSEPAITVVTRTQKARARQLRNNIVTLAQMEDRQFEHVILRDRVGAGMAVAETALHVFADQYRGRYVCHLDDDDWCSSFHFVSRIKEVIKRERGPKLIVFRLFHRPSQTWMPQVWKQFPKEGQITTSNMLVRADLYRDPKYAHALSQDHAGDYAFVHNLLRDHGHEAVWVDEAFFSVTDDRPMSLAFEPGAVTVELQGGLGNQMFQVAAAYAYAARFGKRFALDTTERTISPTAAKPRPSYFEGTVGWTKQYHSTEQPMWNLAKEAGFAFERLPEMDGHVKLVGYFQSPLYFQGYRSTIRSLFLESAPKVDGLLASWPEGKTVSVHIRRADYVGSGLHTVQPIDYYVRAMDRVPKGATPVVFSDDPDWCRKHVPWTNMVMVGDTVKAGVKLTDEQEMVLMSHTNHHIIANSSFSWWGAFLDAKKGTTVAPAKWFNDASMDWSSVYCAEWIVV